MQGQVRIDYVAPKLVTPKGELVLGDLTLFAKEGSGTLSPLRKLFRLEPGDTAQVTYESVKVTR